MINLVSLLQAGKLVFLIHKKMKKTPYEERKARLQDLDQAIKNIDENQDTKELEKWISKNF